MKLLKNLINRFREYMNFNLKLIQHLDKKTKFICTANFFFAMIIIIMQFFVIAFSDCIPTALVTITSIFALFIYFFTNMSSIRKSYKLNYMSQNLEEANLYNNSLQTLHDDVRAFKHDFSNIMQAIGGYITNNDMHGLKAYYSQLFDDCQKVNNLYSLNPTIINNPAIYNIISSKYNKATELGITLNLDVLLNLNDLNMKIYEFSRILGILMDNAIEASSECDEKFIHIEIRKDAKRKRQLLIVENTYLEKDIDIERIFQKGFSSKAHNTGLGLWEVRKILKKNKNLNLYTNTDGHLFKQQLEIYDMDKRQK